MGVREQLGRQPDDEMRLQDLTLETPEKKSKIEFDPEREISKETVSHIVEYLSHLHDTRDWGRYFQLLRNSRIIFPDKEEFNFDSDEEALEAAGKFIDRMAQQVADGSGRLLEYEEDIRQSFSTRLDQIIKNVATKIALRNSCTGTRGNITNLFTRINNSEPIRENCTRVTEEDNSSYGTYVGNFSDSLRIYICNGDSNEISEIINDGSVVWEYGMREMERYRNKDWFEFARIAANYKIIYPKRAGESKVDKKDLAGIKEELSLIENMQQHDWDRKYKPLGVQPNPFEDKWLEYTNLAANLKVLAAKEVKITEQGLELVMQKKETFQQETPPRPERKELN
ncbi:MAG: hypothetical protein HQ530_01270 [Parcubacteria group bacterium]|nr:hypothetical protein [Parcubacteria group bacterium]